MHTITPEQVTAIIPTRGDVDIQPIVDSLIFEEVIVWDNSAGGDYGTWGRYLATNGTDIKYVYSQDDDIIHSHENQLAIVQAYEPRTLTGCMWEEWSNGARKQGIQNGYDDLVFAGSGSVYDASLPHQSAALYTEMYPVDEFFLLWADTILGIISPSKQLDLRFSEMDYAEADNRMANMENAVELKTQAIMRGRQIRDMHKSKVRV